jgi:hypothetical protein
MPAVSEFFFDRQRSTYPSARQRSLVSPSFHAVAWTGALLSLKHERLPSRC